jgi:ABC-type transporter Mla MlaB component
MTVPSETNVVCDVACARADVLTVEALARLQLAARRHGCRVTLRHASEELLQLIAFMGLRDVLPDDPLSLNPRG